MIKSETQIIEICHAALRAYRHHQENYGCIAIGGAKIMPETALAEAVRLVLNRPATTPRGMHENWLVSPYKGILLFPEEQLVPWTSLTPAQQTEYVMLCNLINSFRGYAVEPIQITIKQAEKIVQPVDYDRRQQDRQDAKDQATLTRIEAVMFVILGAIITLGVLVLFP